MAHPTQVNLVLKYLQTNFLSKRSTEVVSGGSSFVIISYRALGQSPRKRGVLLYPLPSSGQNGFSRDSRQKKPPVKSYLSVQE